MKKRSTCKFYVLLDVMCGRFAALKVFGLGSGNWMDCS